MFEIKLIPMTKELCRLYYKDFENDSDIFMDMSKFKNFSYSDEWADLYFERQREKQRIFFAIMCDNVPVGELIFKNIDSEKAECEMSIHLQNDSVKGKGIGTLAEKLAVNYAFNNMGMKMLLADCVLKNTRSQHVLEKIGFEFVMQKDNMRFYRLSKESYLKMSH